MRLRKLSLFACAAFSMAVFSAAAQESCKPTAKLSPHPYPGTKKIASGNHLAKPAGKSVFSEGEPLRIAGKLLDKHCNPVRDARIEIWHANPEGKYHYANAVELASETPVFAGGGSTYSLGNGRFTFFTIFPGAAGKRPPYINIRVRAEEMQKVFQTRLFFGGDIRNNTDRLYQGLSPTRKESVTMRVRQHPSGGHEAEVTLVLPEKVGRLSY